MSVNKIAEVINSISTELDEAKRYLTAAEYQSLVNDITNVIAPFLIKTADNKGKVIDSHTDINSPEFIKFLENFTLKNSPVTRAISYFLPEIDKELMITANPAIEDVNNPEHENLVDVADTYRDYASIKQVNALLDSVSAAGSIDDLHKLQRVAFLLKNYDEHIINKQLPALLSATMGAQGELLSPEDIIALKSSVANELVQNPFFSKKVEDIKSKSTYATTDMSDKIKKLKIQKIKEFSQKINDIMILSGADLTSNPIYIETQQAIQSGQIDKINIDALLNAINNDKKQITKLSSRQLEALNKSKMGVFDKLWDEVSSTIDRMYGEIQLIDTTLDTLNEYYHVLIDPTYSAYVNTDTGANIADENSGIISENSRNFMLSKLYTKIQDLKSKIYSVDTSGLTEEEKVSAKDDLQYEISKIENQYGTTEAEINKAYTSVQGVNEKANLPGSSELDRQLYNKAKGSGENANVNLEKAFEVVNLYKINKEDLSTITPETLIQNIEILNNQKDKLYKAIENITKGNPDMASVRDNLYADIKSGKTSIKQVHNLCKQYATSYASLFGESNYISEDTVQMLDNADSQADMFTESIEQSSGEPEVAQEDSYQYFMSDTPSATTTVAVPPESGSPEEQPVFDNENLDFSDLEIPVDNAADDELKNASYINLIRKATDAYNESLQKKKTENTTQLVDSAITNLAGDIKQDYTTIVATSDSTINNFVDSINTLKTAVLSADEALAAEATNLLARVSSTVNTEPLHNAVNELKNIVTEMVNTSSTVNQAKDISKIDMFTLADPKIPQQKQAVDTYNRNYAAVCDTVKRWLTVLNGITKRIGNQISPELLTEIQAYQDRLTTFLNTGLDAITQEMVSSGQMWSDIDLNYLGSKIVSSLNKAGSDLISEKDVISFVHGSTKIKADIAKMDGALKAIMHDPIMAKELKDNARKQDTSVSRIQKLIQSMDAAGKSTDTPQFVEALTDIINSPVLTMLSAKNDKIAPLVTAITTGYNAILLSSDKSALYGSLKSMMNIVNELKDLCTSVYNMVAKRKETIVDESMSSVQASVQYLQMLKLAAQDVQAEDSADISNKSLLKLMGHGTKRRFNNISKSSTDKDTADVSKQKTLLAQNVILLSLGKEPLNHIDNTTNNSIATSYMNDIAALAKMTYAEAYNDEKQAEKYDNLVYKLSNVFKVSEEAVKEYFEYKYGRYTSGYGYDPSTDVAPINDGKASILYDFVRNINPAVYVQSKQYLESNNYNVTGLETFVDSYKDSTFTGLGRVESEIATMTNEGGLAGTLKQLNSTLTKVKSNISAYAEQVKPVKEKKVKAQ